MLYCEQDVKQGLICWTSTVFVQRGTTLRTARKFQKQSRRAGLGGLEEDGIVKKRRGHPEHCVLPVTGSN